MPTPTADLRASLEKHNDVFESLLKLIPAQFYIVNDETEDKVWKTLSPYLFFFLKKKKNKKMLKDS